MAKFKPGIPDSFTLDVNPVTDLGDYLDEPRPTPAVPRKARGEVAPPPQHTGAASTPEPSVVASPATPPPAASTPPDAPEPRLAAQPAAAPAVPTPTMTPANAVVPGSENEREERGGKPKAPRREISMTPETLRMSDELLEVIRSGSGQRDTKANELFHALVLLVHDVIGEIDAHTIPRRGRWGTPTARAYPLELKAAFLRALLMKYGHATDEVGALEYPVNTAA